MPDYNKPEETGAPFNMAIATLQRLSELLQEIKTISSDPEYPLEIRQSRKITLVKQFFIQATPLLPKEIIKECEKEILDLKPKIIKRVQQDGWLSSSAQTYYEAIFDFNLDRILDEILIKIQSNLQKEKYFMPSKTDPKFSWRES